MSAFSEVPTTAEWMSDAFLVFDGRGGKKGRRSQVCRHWSDSIFRNLRDLIRSRQIWPNVRVSKSISSRSNNHNSSNIRSDHTWSSQWSSSLFQAALRSAGNFALSGLVMCSLLMPLMSAGWAQLGFLQHENSTGWTETVFMARCCCANPWRTACTPGLDRTRSDNWSSSGSCCSVSCSGKFSATLKISICLRPHRFARYFFTQSFAALWSSLIAG